MADLISLDRERRKRLQQRATRHTLCQSGFHRWKVVDTPFDVHQGRLITVERCERCGCERRSAR